MKKYTWLQISMWDIPMDRDFVRLKRIKTGLSEAVCTYVLARQFNLGSGEIKCIRVHKDCVTPEKIAIAGECGT